MSERNEATIGRTKVLIKGFLPRVPEIKMNKRRSEYSSFSVGVPTEVQKEGKTAVIPKFFNVMAVGNAIPILKGVRKGAEVELTGELDTYKGPNDEFYRTTIRITEAKILEGRRVRKEQVVEEVEEDFELFDEESNFF